MTQIQFHKFRNILISEFIVLSFILSFVLSGCIHSGDSSKTVPASVSSESFSRHSEGLTVFFLDVGQADAALLSCDGYHILIDGGNKDDSNSLYSIMTACDIRTLDLVIATHPDEDHIGGLPGALIASAGKEILCPATEYDSESFRDFQTYADLRSNGIQIPSEGDRYVFGDLVLEVLAVNCGSSSNDSSIVAKATYGETSFLFTGDAERMTENHLLSDKDSLKSSVLKVSHHGSGESTSSDFLKAVDPDYAVISVGKNNPYGHPDRDTLNRLNAQGICICRTDVHGNLIFHSDGINLSVFTGQTVFDKAECEQTASHVLNLRSKKFHSISCDSISDMSEHNKLYYTGDRDEAIALHFTPCGVCHP